MSDFWLMAIIIVLSLGFTWLLDRFVHGGGLWELKARYEDRKEGFGIYRVKVKEQKNGIQRRLVEIDTLYRQGVYTGEQYLRLTHKALDIFDAQAEIERQELNSKIQSNTWEKPTLIEADSLEELNAKVRSYTTGQSRRIVEHTEEIS